MWWIKVVTVFYPLNGVWINLELFVRARLEYIMNGRAAMDQMKDGLTDQAPSEDYYDARKGSPPASEIEAKKTYTGAWRLASNGQLLLRSTDPNGDVTEYVWYDCKYVRACPCGYKEPCDVYCNL